MRFGQMSRFTPCAVVPRLDDPPRSHRLNTLYKHENHRKRLLAVDGILHGLELHAVVAEAAGGDQGPSLKDGFALAGT